MEFRDRLEKDVVVFELNGKIMSCTDGAPLRERVQQYVQEGKKRFIVDLTGVSWLNSEGVGIIATLMTSIRSDNGTLLLSGMNEKVKKVLSITGCTDVIKNFATYQEAFDFLKEK
jgi:anti-sigma B factor antagonist